MSNDNRHIDDTVPRNAPKPAPLGIIAVATPLVPEVSLLIDQEKNKSFHNSTPLQDCVVYPVDDTLGNNLIKQQQKEVLQSHQSESYNTWKAKNAEALNIITGSSGRSETVTRDSIKFNSIRQKQPVACGIPYSKRTEIVGSLVAQSNISNSLCSNQVNKPRVEFHRNDSYSVPIKVAYNFDQQFTSDQQKPEFDRKHNTCVNVAQDKAREVYQPMREMYMIPKESEHRGQNYSSLKSVNKVHSNERLVHARAMPVDASCPHRIMQTNEDSEVSSNYRAVDFGACECQYTKTGNHNGLHILNSKLVSPLDIGQINNQINNLYHVIHLQNEQIHLQNEQISMLQQQMKQILEIHLDYDRSVKQKVTSHNCSCEQKHDCTKKINTSVNFSGKSVGLPDNNSECKKPTQILSSVGHKDVTKRSIGIMTTPVKDSTNSHSDSNENSCERVRNRKENPLKPKYQQKEQINHFRIHPHNETSSSRDILHKEKKRKQTTKPVRKTKKIEPEPYNQIDNSFSLNEAELVIISDCGQDDISPNSSVHIDLQDYCSSSEDSDESDRTESSNDEEEEESETDDETSDPQLGWTFYNQVVGQVNNILKKTKSPVRQEQVYMTKRNPSAHYMYNVQGNYDAENNWSKRVTFDGPPLEDSDNVMKARYVLKPNEDFRGNGQPERMQDFMMYNIEKGKTNLSFSTLRYLEHYHLLPSQIGPKKQDNIYEDQQENIKTSRKKKNKSRKPKVSSKSSQQQTRREKSTGSSSKLLDITALKQQPKLF